MPGRVNSSACGPGRPERRVRGGARGRCEVDRAQDGSFAVRDFVRMHRRVEWSAESNRPRCPRCERCALSDAWWRDCARVAPQRVRQHAPRLGMEGASGTFKGTLAGNGSLPEQIALRSLRADFDGDDGGRRKPSSDAELADGDIPACRERVRCPWRARYRASGATTRWLHALANAFQTATLRVRNVAVATTADGITLTARAPVVLDGRRQSQSHAVAARRDAARAHGRCADDRRFQSECQRRRSAAASSWAWRPTAIAWIRTARCSMRMPSSRPRSLTALSAASI